jgi:membrane fusion protein, heavy metal efflux system
MKKRFIIVHILSAVVLLFTSCGGKKTADTEKKEEIKPQEQVLPNIVSLTNEQVKAIGVEYGTIQQKNLNSAIKVNGILTVPNQNKATITSLFPGTIRSLTIQPGNTVRQGQTLAVIVNPELVQLQQQYLSVNTKMNLAELEYDRQKMLVEGNAGARKNLQQAETELKTLGNEKAALQKQLSTMGISPARINSGNITASLIVSSPISGTVSKVNAQIGTYVDASTAIAEVVNNSQLHLDLFVYEKDLPQVNAGQTIHFTLTNSPGKEYDATIYSIGTAFEDQSKTISVHATVKGDKTGLIEGMNVTAIISIGTSLAAAVPDDAIVNYQGKDYIFMKTESKDGVSFKRVEVVRGASDLGYTEIKPLEEIPATSQIAIKGVFFLLAKMTNAGEEE